MCAVVDRGVTLVLFWSKRHQCQRFIPSKTPGICSICKECFFIWTITWWGGEHMPSPHYLFKQISQIADSYASTTERKKMPLNKMKNLVWSVANAMQRHLPLALWSQVWWTRCRCQKEPTCRLLSSWHRPMDSPFFSQGHPDGTGCDLFSNMQQLASTSNIIELQLHRFR